ncbi:MAG: hypothetical protein E6G03_07705 [Actinobacteria bacterium]|nr:MAG: hypothetical protein E6G03_07705 [Actinomycetota bacterium]
MSRHRFAYSPVRPSPQSLKAASWFWVIGPVAVTVDVRVWVCASVLFVSQMAVLPESAAAFLAVFAPPPTASWLIVTDWCACRSAVVSFPFVFEAEPSRLMFWVTQAVFPLEPLETTCVISAVYCADWVSPDTFMVLS